MAKNFLLLVVTLCVLASCGRPDGWSASTYPATSVARNALPSGTVTVERPTTATIDISGPHRASFVGWAFDGVHNAPCGQLIAVIDRRRAIPVQYGVSRSDVATYFKNYALNDVGFGLVLSPQELGLGTHHMYLVCIDSSGQIGRRNATTYTINVSS